MARIDFEGFSKTLPDFLTRLRNNNTREWFEQHKAEFQSVINEPALKFIDAMGPVVSRFSPPLKAEARLNGSLRRIHRDVRFSKDKTPYSPRLHIIFWTGDHPNRSPASHVVLGPDYLGIGAGQWGLDAGQLSLYRTALLDQQKLRQLSEAVADAANDQQMLGEAELKRLPKGFEEAGKDSLLMDLLRRKSVVVRSGNTPYCDQVFGKQCVAYFTARLNASHAVNRWLVENLS